MSCPSPDHQIYHCTQYGAFEWLRMIGHNGGLLYSICSDCYSTSSLELCITKKEIGLRLSIKDFRSQSQQTSVMSYVPCASQRSIASRQ